MILFLDFDGVLHPKGANSDQLFRKAPLIWSLLGMLPELQVVFSTSWIASYPLDDLINFATYGGGETLASRFIGSTPSVPLDPTRNITGPVYRRELECLAWLGERASKTAWIALDDEATNFTPSTPHWHAVEGKEGLTAQDILQVQTALRQQEFQRNPAIHAFQGPFWSLPCP